MLLGYKRNTHRDTNVHYAAKGLGQSFLQRYPQVEQLWCKFRSQSRAPTNPQPTTHNPQPTTHNPHSPTHNPPSPSPTHTHQHTTQTHQHATHTNTQLTLTNMQPILTDMQPTLSSCAHYTTHNPVTIVSIICTIHNTTKLFHLLKVHIVLNNHTEMLIKQCVKIFTT